MLVTEPDRGAVMGIARSFFPETVSMPISDTLQRNKIPISIASGVLIVLASVYIVIQLLTPRGGVAKPPEATAFYFDMKTKQEFIAIADPTPPIAAPSGGDGVRLYKMGCGDCSNPFRAYLQKYDSEVHALAKALEQNPDAAPPELGAQNLQREEALEKIADGLMVAAPDKPDEWVRANSDEGQAIVAAAEKKCPAGFRMCSP